MAGDWSDEQNDAIVADYFVMLAVDIAGRPYSKAEHNRLLWAMIDRPRGSIEYKHQNISAVLKGLARKYDVAGRDARNRALGRAGEERVLAHERANLFAAGLYRPRPARPLGVACRW
jgi:hypothetical protein